MVNRNSINKERHSNLRSVFFGENNHRGFKGLSRFIKFTKENSEGGGLGKIINNSQTDDLPISLEFFRKAPGVNWC